ncbi:MAG: AI-2E family transporter [Flavobacteriales bacterium]|nr:AI-2E family transporter [Flavobacteriales bacterium]
MKNLAYTSISIAGILVLLYLGKGILIPFVFGLLLWFLARSLKNLFERISFVKKYFPKWITNLLVFGVLILGIGFVSKMLTSSISSLLTSYDSYQTNLTGVLENVNQYLHIDIFESMKSAMGSFNFSSILSEIANSISGVFSETFMIIIYTLFIFLEESSFKEKLVKIASSPENHERTNSILNKVNTSVGDYLRLKTLVSLITGFLSYIALIIVGVDAPIFWAFLIFLLNYIPTIGSLIATLFPAIFSLIQFGELAPFITVLVAVGSIQVIIGNIVEPRIMGKSLNLSPLATILALSLWGQIWGIVGMILSVPITVILVIALSQFKGSRNIALMLSEKGDVDEMT